MKDALKNAPRVRRMIVPVKVTFEGKSIETYAMLDGGATNPVIKEELAEKLKLKYQEKESTLVTLGAKTPGIRKFTEFSVTSFEGDVNLKMEKAVVMNDLTTDSDIPPSNEEVEGEKYLEGVSFKELSDKSVNMIIPVGYGWCWLGGEVRRSTIDKPIGVKTKFGWALAGGKIDKEGTMPSCYKMSIEHDDEGIREDIQRLFNKEFPNILENKVHESRDDKYAMEQMEKTIKFDEEIGHYRVGLPWKTSREEAAKKMNPIDSSRTSMIRLKKQIKKIKEDKQYFPEGEYFEHVKKQMNNMFDDGYVEVLKENNVEEGVPTWVMPLNVVYQPHKPTKPRCCHDGKAKTGGGKFE